MFKSNQNFKQTVEDLEANNRSAPKPPTLMQVDLDDIAILEGIKQKEYIQKRKCFLITGLLAGFAILMMVIAIVGLTFAIEDNKNNN